MSAGIQNLLNVSLKALTAQTQALRVHGDNISNVNTEGYSRRKAELVTEATVAGTAIGAGVNVNKVVRMVDQFINAELASRTTDRAYAQIRDEFLNRAESLFALDGSADSIGSRLSSFFSSLEDLAMNPSSIPLRSQVIEDGKSLVQSINSTFQALAQLQREADSRLESMVSSINGLSAQIADLNAQLFSSETSGQENLTLRDQRDKLVQDLNELVEVNTVENSDGALIVYLANGFALVKGSENQELEYTKSPDFDNGVDYPPALDGSALGFIVYDFDSTDDTAHVDLTQVIASGGGEMGGLLSLRGVQDDTDTDTFHATGDLVAIAGRVEAIARDLLVNFNRTYIGPDEDPGTAGYQPSSGDLDGNQPAFDGLFTFAGLTDANANGRMDTSDLTAYTAANGGFASFASVIEFGVDDPRAIAAARDADAAPGSTSFPPGDAQNIEALLARRSEQRTFSLPAVNPLFTATSTIEDFYDTTVSHVGSVASRAKSDLETYTAREEQLKELKASESGVSLDEEFAKLISYQRAFEGAAKLVTLADDMMAQILSMVR